MSDIYFKSIMIKGEERNALVIVTDEELEAALSDWAEHCTEHDIPLDLETSTILAVMLDTMDAALDASMLNEEELKDE